MKKIALIGLGRWGRNILRELINLGGEVVIVLNTKSEEKEAWLKENYPNTKFTYSHEEVKVDLSLKEVVIATPMETHFALVKEYIEADKKVFVEKPITTTYKEAVALLSQAKERNAELMVGHIFLYHECFLRLRELLRSKKVTGISVRKTILKPVAPDSSFDVFLNSFIHEVSIFLKLFGSPVKSYYDKEKATFTMEFKDFKASVTVVQLPVGEKMRRFEFETTDGGYIWNNDELFEKGHDTALLKSEKSSLNSELNIFLNLYNEWEKEIMENNQIGAESVKILEEIFG